MGSDMAPTLARSGWYGLSSRLIRRMASVPQSCSRRVSGSRRRNIFSKLTSRAKAVTQDIRIDARTKPISLIRASACVEGVNTAVSSTFTRCQSAAKFRCLITVQVGRSLASARCGWQTSPPPRSPVGLVFCRLHPLPGRAAGLTTRSAGHGNSVNGCEQT